MRSRWIVCGAALLAALGVFGVPSCTNETVYLLKQPVTDSGAPTAPVQKCASSNDCPSDQFCLLPSCTATDGTCIPTPLTCGDAGPDDSVASFECGCDKNTYWNDCLRRRYAVSSYTPGPCPQSASPPCGEGIPGSVPCGEGYWCAQLGGAMHGSSGGDPCSHGIPGSCWALPAICPTQSPNLDLLLFDSCTSPGPICTDTCNAIKKGGSWRGSFDCQ